MGVGAGGCVGVDFCDDFRFVSLHEEQPGFFSSLILTPSPFSVPFPPPLPSRREPRHRAVDASRHECPDAGQRVRRRRLHRLQPHPLLLQLRRQRHLQAGRARSHPTAADEHVLQEICRWFLQPAGRQNSREKTNGEDIIYSFSCSPFLSHYSFSYTPIICSLSNPPSPSHLYSYTHFPSLFHLSVCLPVSNLLNRTVPLLAAGRPLPGGGGPRAGADG